MKHNVQESYIDIFGTDQDGDEKLIEDVHVTYWSDEHGHFQFECDVEERATDERAYIDWSDVEEQITEEFA